MAYKGGVSVTGGFYPANNQNFPIINAPDVYVSDDQRLDTALEELWDAIDNNSSENSSLDVYDTTSGIESVKINAAEPQCPLEVILSSGTYTDFSNVTVTLTSGGSSQSVISGADGVVTGLNSEAEFELTLTSTDVDFDPTLVTIICRYKLDIEHVLHDYVLHVDIDGDGSSGGNNEDGQVSVIIDKTLLIAGAAADAKAVGDAINNLSDSVANKITSPTSAAVGQTIMVKTVDENGAPTEWEAADFISGTGTNVEVDTTLSVSGAAADAKITGDEIYSLKSGKVSTTRTINGKPLDEDIVLSAADINAIPDSRTINGKPLNADIVLTAEDIGVVNVETDATLKTEGMAADAKATGDAINEINSKLDDVVDNIYIQNEEPTDAPENSIWVDLDDDGLPNAPESTSANVYVVDAATTDIATVDFSVYAVGDVVLVTVS